MWLFTASMDAFVVNADEDIIFCFDWFYSFALCICIAGGGANDAMHYYIIDMITNNIVRSGQNSKMWIFSLSSFSITFILCLPHPPSVSPIATNLMMTSHLFRQRRSQHWFMMPYLYLLSVYKRWNNLIHYVCQIYHVPMSMPGTMDSVWSIT